MNPYPRVNKLDEEIRGAPHPLGETEYMEMRVLATDLEFSNGQMREALLGTSGCLHSVRSFVQKFRDRTDATPIEEVIEETLRKVSLALQEPSKPKTAMERIRDHVQTLQRIEPEAVEFSQLLNRILKLTEEQEKPPESDQLEEMAKAIYSTWRLQNGWVPWQEHGTSETQTRARLMAREALSYAGSVYTRKPHE